MWYFELRLCKLNSCIVHIIESVSPLTPQNYDLWFLNEATPGLLHSTSSNKIFTLLYAVPTLKLPMPILTFLLRLSKIPEQLDGNEKFRKKITTYRIHHCIRVLPLESTLNAEPQPSFISPIFLLASIFVRVFPFLA